MSIEQIEKFLSDVQGWIDRYPESEINSVTAFPVIQCQLLLLIYKKLDDIKDRLDSIDREIFESRHNT